MNKEEIIRRSREVHGNKLMYVKCVYTNARNVVELYCTEKDKEGIAHLS